MGASGTLPLGFVVGGAVGVVPVDSPPTEPLGFVVGLEVADPLLDLLSVVFDPLERVAGAPLFFVAVTWCALALLPLAAVFGLGPTEPAADPVAEERPLGRVATLPAAVL